MRTLHCDRSGAWRRGSPDGQAVGGTRAVVGNCSQDAPVCPRLYLLEGDNRSMYMGRYIVPIEHPSRE
jgi:hypothetical protein